MSSNRREQSITVVCVKTTRRPLRPVIQLLGIAAGVEERVNPSDRVQPLDPYCGVSGIPEMSRMLGIVD
ncbi:hypothetical protein GCM10027052_10460 [Parafrigoribacterium mesophilum]